MTPQEVHTGPAQPTSLAVPPEPALPVVVIDTNVVLDWLLFDDPSVAGLAACVAARRVLWRASTPMRDELAHVLQRGLAAEHHAEPAALLLRFDRHACVQAADPVAHPLRCTDADDQKFLELAFATRARWLVTRDRALLKLARRAAPLGLSILPAARWLAPW